MRRTKWEMKRTIRQLNRYDALSASFIVLSASTIDLSGSITFHYEAPLSLYTFAEK